ncbi:MAG: hypothetical protein KBS44_02395 [Clostridiales bacterium]|nr:hypothetical protein [Candidatus Coliplasma equi]
MDYQGFYFPEDHDEHESKIYRVVKGIFKCALYGISFLIYAVLLFMLAVNRDSIILTSNYMKDTAIMSGVDTDTVAMRHLYTKEYMNADEDGTYIGSIQLFDVDHATDYGILELGVKYNVNKLTAGIKDDILEYSLIGPDGKEHQIVNRVFTSSPKGGRYSFVRLCFSDVEIDYDSNGMVYDNVSQRTDNTYTLNVYDTNANGRGKLLDSFIVYDNETNFETTKYEVSNNVGFIILCSIITILVILFLYSMIRKKLKNGGNK